MTETLSPAYSVKIDFQPDSAVKDNAVWSVCLYGVGMSGQLTFSDVKNVTQIEGGSITVKGSFQVGNPWDLSDFCSQTPPELPCCAH